MRDVDFPALATLPVAAREPPALRDDAVLTFFTAPVRPRFADVVDRAEDAPAAAADLPRDFVLFDRFLPALRDEVFAFARDFLALVAIASPRSR